MMIRKCGYALLIGSLALGLTACGGTKEKKETEKSELVITITPHIIKDTEEEIIESEDL